MLGDLFTKPQKDVPSKDQFSFSADTVRACFNTQLKSDPTHYSEFEHLNRLVLAYLFRCLTDKCNPDIEESSTLENFRCPDYRRTIAGRLPQQLNAFLHYYNQYQDLPGYFDKTKVPESLIDHTLKIANSHHCFSRKSSLPNTRNDLFKMYQPLELAVLFCAGIFHSHISSSLHSSDERKLFDLGVRNAFTAMKLAQGKGSHPIKIFTSCLIRQISLIYVYQALKNEPTLAKEPLLLDHLSFITSRLGYWLAKDWGINDGMQYILKQRFYHTSEASGQFLSIQKSEHINLAIDLYEEKLLSRKQLQSFYKLLDIENSISLEQLSQYHH